VLGIWTIIERDSIAMAGMFEPIELTEQAITQTTSSCECHAD